MNSIKPSFYIDNCFISFTNLITYCLDKDFKEVSELKEFFWISEIFNYPRKEFQESNQPRFYDMDIGYPEMSFKYGGPDIFYIQYKTESFEE
jgi:hypothetical protein